MMVMLAILALVIGLMIGTVGIGGVLLAPALILLLGFDVQLAIATSLWSFLFTGLMGAYSYHHKGSIDWRKTGWLVIGIIPASFVGAQTNVSLPPAVVTGILAAVILYSALNVLWQRKAPDGTKTQILPILLIVIGIVVGFGSALTGTGGAVMLMPIFLLMKVPALMAVGIVQGIQLPHCHLQFAGICAFWRGGFCDWFCYRDYSGRRCLYGCSDRTSIADGEAAPLRRLRPYSICRNVVAAVLYVRRTLYEALRNNLRLNEEPRFLEASLSFGNQKVNHSLQRFVTVVVAPSSEISGDLAISTCAAL